MSERRVHQCIRKAQQIELAKLESSWESPLAGVVLVDRHAKLSRIFKQIALMPVTVPMVLILALIWPLKYLAHMMRVSKKKAAIESHFKTVGVNLDKLETSERTLSVLWSQCRPSDVSIPRGISLELLCEWVDILYGPGRSTELRIRERAKVIGNRNAMANRPYYEGRKGAVHYYMESPVEILIEELSKELPRYSS